ncbi:biogenesis of lysosome-related organelles complex 1 subunit 4-like protein [Dinothrombium tinctorium]|uniref:Biogenesis of lysosome-related organelles complex 1 subunit 4-like protein n=1 Tax=Dinothrombium tinctorium TaxID=1965070 RepID=A0A3S3NF24_9ACAR|nr:biogenesis of lysosome-related organelles complex 1 subunit 4-like protein [Dinothrombium tinctorium]
MSSEASANHESNGVDFGDEHKLRQLSLELAEDYSKYFAIDTSNEITSFEEAVEEKLTHLEEFCGVIDMIREQNSVCLEQKLPIVYAKCTELEDLFRSIDRLEEMVKIVKATVDAMECEVIKAEELFANNKIKKFLSSFWNNKRRSSDSRKPKYVEPKLFSTKDFFCDEQSAPVKSDDESEKT